MNVAEGKQKILELLKGSGEATTAEVASRLDVTYEAARQQLKQLEAAQLVCGQRRTNPSGVGRPLRYYALSEAGDQLFPKAYDELAVALIDAIGAELGEEGLRQVLAALGERQAARLAQRLAGGGLQERLERLQAFYMEDDPYMDVRRKKGQMQLVERNCPYLSTALKRPALCSVTVSTLERLLGRRVTRQKRFQDGDGCCVFEVHQDDVLGAKAQTFRFEKDEV